MRVEDSVELREILLHLFPSLNIESSVDVPSGQRLVYFCNFGENTDVKSQKKWNKWGAVVLKVSIGVRAEIVARLEKESEILNELNSPFFPKQYYYDAFSEDPVTESNFPYRIFITIEERIHGQPLAACKEKYKTEAEVIDLLLDLFKGLSLLWNHKRKIVHRDLKPDNILIGDGGQVVIIDLGYLREEGTDGLTVSAHPYGPCTPAYASPEQINNDKRIISFKSDCFTLGVLAYELLSGSPPFKDESLGAIFTKVLTVVPEALNLNHDVSEELSIFISRLMEKEPYKRYRTVEKMIDDLLSIKELIV